MEKCFITGLTCPKIECDLYHEATQICKIVMLVNRTLGHIDGPVITPPTTIPAQTPVAESMKSDNPFPELKVGGFLPSIAGRITSPIEVREVTAQGKPTPIAEFGITDGATVIPVTVWDPEDRLNGFNVGSWITLTAMSIREYKNETQISTTRGSKISR